MNNDMSGKVSIVTGANSGIGLETAAGLVNLGATVVLACRDEAKAASAIKTLDSRGGRGKGLAMRLDLASQESIRDFARAFQQKFDRLEVLVNNAGLMPRARQLTKDGFEMQFGVNHLGPFLLTTLLLDLLKKSTPSRIVVVSSTMHKWSTINFEDLQGEKKYHYGRAYGQSKLANVMFTCALARRLEGSGVTVNCLHPGGVRTNFVRDLSRPMRALYALGLTLTPAQGARTSVYLASSPEVSGVSGRYFAKSKPARPSKLSQDIGAQERLWQISERLTDHGA
jgi:retinol dehydrogenase-12/retinol dehydrogenase-13